MLRHHRLILSVLGIAAISISAVASAATITSPWQYGEPVMITGSGLLGDDPETKQLCIAPDATPNDSTCYYDFQLQSLTWTNSQISFLPPDDAPVSGKVTLKLRTGTQKCFDSAGCDTFDEDTTEDIGSFTVVPFIGGVETAGVPATQIEPSKTYTIQGRFFGKDTGSVFLRQSRGSAELPVSAIVSWSDTDILFTTPADIEPAAAISVNNHANAEWFELSSAASEASSRSPSQQTAKSSSSRGGTGKQADLFADVQASHPYASAILWAKTSGVLQGYPDGTFRPDVTVNRAEFLKIVLAAKGINVGEDSGTSGFSDVDEHAWYAPYVRYAKAQGIIQGYPDGTFKPEQAVNFAEALKMAYVALGIDTSETGGSWYERYLAHAKANSVLFSSDAAVDGGMSRKDVVWIVWKLLTHEGTWDRAQESSSQRSSASATAGNQAAQFTDGTHVVGTEIQPGTYRTRTGSPGCYYARLGGFSGELTDILANENTNDPAVVTIDADDKGFQSERCGMWTQDLSPITASRTSFGGGTFLVGTDIEPGTYRSKGGSACYYARLAGFSGELKDIIANENTDASAVVTITPGDAGFTSSGCGTWSKVD